MANKDLQVYLKQDNKTLLALIAYKVENVCDHEIPQIHKHLESLNGNVTKNSTRLSEIEIRNAVEKEYNHNKTNGNRKLKAVYIGGGGTAAAFLYFMIELIVKSFG